MPKSTSQIYLILILFLKIKDYYFKNASIEWEWAGLRPSRGPTRVERENFKRKDNSSAIVS